MWNFKQIKNPAFGLPKMTQFTVVEIRLDLQLVLQTPLTVLYFAQCFGSVVVIYDSFYS